MECLFHESRSARGSARWVVVLALGAVLAVGFVVMRGRRAKETPEPKRPARMAAGEEATARFVDWYWWIHPDWQPQDHGRWRLEVRGDSGSVEGDFLFAEDCAAEEFVAEEFVQEPGTVLLLGSGTAGMAAYAALRLRAQRR